MSPPAPAAVTSSDDRLPADIGRRWLIIVGVWSVPAFLAACETWMFWRLGNRPGAFWQAVAMEAPPWMVYALLTPLIFALGRRLPLQRPRVGRRLAAHLTASLTIAALYAVVATTAMRLFTPTPMPMSVGRMMLSWYLSGLPLTTLTYFGTLGTGFALTYFGESRQRAIDAERLTAQLAEARLGALRMQLHPHFLFNTLNAITVLARDGDTVAVTRMLTLLSELLRDVLRTDTGHLIPLETELAFARRYLELQLVRFADRLRVDLCIEDRARELTVPAFVLQPLIENALRHGIAPRGVGGAVEIGARVAEDGLLELWVSDDGIGLPTDWNGADDYGIGLSNTAARVQSLHGSAGALVVEPAPRGGTRSLLRLPAT